MPDNARHKSSAVFKSVVSGTRAFCSEPVSATGPRDPQDSIQEALVEKGADGDALWDISIRQVRKCPETRLTLGQHSRHARFFRLISIAFGLELVTWVVLLPDQAMSSNVRKELEHLTKGHISLSAFGLIGAASRAFPTPQDRAEPGAPSLQRHNGCDTPSASIRHPGEDR